jgi:Zn-dependent protease
MDVSNEQVRQALLSVVAFVLSVSFHEFGHAFVADRLGDGLPRAQGRVTLSPWRHIDPLGTIVVPLLATFASGVPFIAWGKPVQTNPSAMTSRFPRAVNNLMVSLAGPIMNLLLAVLISVLLVAVARGGYVSRGLAEQIVKFMVVLNLSLMFFNLLPIPPLDGGSILAIALPARWRGVMPLLQRYGMLVIILLFMTGMGSTLMRPAARLAAAWADVLMGLIPG